MANTTTKEIDKKTMTNWQAFVDAGLIPTRIVCDGYQPVHRFNQGCHTALQLNAKTMIEHFKADHGGGFVISLRRTDNNAKAWPGWKELADAGFEIIDLRDEAFGEELPLDPRFLLKAMAPRKGANGRVKSGGVFLMTIADQVSDNAFATE